MVEVLTVNHDDPEKAIGRPQFEDLTPLFPDERLVQERPDERYDMTSRIIDLIDRSRHQEAAAYLRDEHWSFDVQRPYISAYYHMDDPEVRTIANVGPVKRGSKWPPQPPPTPRHAPEEMGQ